MNYDAFTYEELKAEEEIAKKEFLKSSITLKEKKRLLSENIGIIKIDQNLTAFNDYVCSLSVKHKHLPAFSETLRKYFSRREDVDAVILDNYITELNNHIGIHTHYINLKIAMRHRNIIILPENILIKQYEIFFANDEKKLANKDIIEEHLNKIIESKNGGKPAINKVFIRQEKKKPKKKDDLKPVTYTSKRDEPKIQFLSNDDLAFDDLTISVEFTNGVKGTLAIYANGIYFKHNGNSSDGKQENVFTYFGEATNRPVTKEDIISKIINDKEKSND